MLILARHTPTRHAPTQNRTQRVAEIKRLEAELDEARRPWDAAGEKRRDSALENIQRLAETLKEKRGELRAVQGARHSLRPTPAPHSADGRMTRDTTYKDKQYNDAE